MTYYQPDQQSSGGGAYDAMFHQNTGNKINQSHLSKQKNRNSRILNYHMNLNAFEQKDDYDPTYSYEGISNRSRGDPHGGKYVAPQDQISAFDNHVNKFSSNFQISSGGGSGAGMSTRDYMKNAHYGGLPHGGDNSYELQRIENEKKTNKYLEQRQMNFEIANAHLDSKPFDFYDYSMTANDETLF